MMNAFVTHPSIRMRGTENNFEPLQCLDVHCLHQQNAHMHCPFCTTADGYQDPVILRAHYRVKHVDKGIDFAGLKILRCCNHCDIVGAIKGQKAFKGAHWHCYRCRNGFNRKDEALKHYRTHFRNPKTTFQIQITQDLYQQTPGNSSHFEERIVGSANGSTTSIKLVDTQVISAISNGRTEGDMHNAVAANETVDACDGQTIMIIQEPTDTEIIEQDQASPLIVQPMGDELSLILQQKSEAEEQVEQLTMRVQQLEQEAEEARSKQEQEIESLKAQHAEEIRTHQQREAALINQLSIQIDDRMMELLHQLKNSHENLLHEQMAVLKRSFLSSLQEQAKTGLLTEDHPIFLVSPESLSKYGPSENEKRDDTEIESNQTKSNEGNLDPQIGLFTEQSAEISNIDKEESTKSPEKEEIMIECDTDSQSLEIQPAGNDPLYIDIDLENNPLNKADDNTESAKSNLTRSKVNILSRQAKRKRLT